MFITALFPFISSSICPCGHSSFFSYKHSSFTVSSSQGSSGQVLAYDPSLPFFHRRLLHCATTPSRIVNSPRTMAAIAPSHRIHTIHGTFNCSLVATSSAAQSFTHLPNVSVAPSSRGAGLSVLSGRTASNSSSLPSERRYPTSTRRAPPPPPARSITFVSDDNPFADGPLEVVVPPRTARSSPRPLIASRTRITAHIIPATAIASPSMAIASEEITHPPSRSGAVALPPGIEPEAGVPGHKLARGRLVASVLLNRGCGRPLRRRFSGSGEGREYVKSGLSRVVAMEG